MPRACAVVTFLVLLGSSCQLGQFDYPAFAPESFAELDRPWVFYTPIVPENQKGLYNTATHQTWLQEPMEGDPGYFAVLNTDTLEIEKRLRWTEGKLYIFANGVTDQKKKVTYFLTNGIASLLKWDHRTGVLSRVMSLGEQVGAFPQMALVASGVFIRGNFYDESGRLHFYYVNPEKSQVLWTGQMDPNSLQLDFADPATDQVLLRDFNDPHGNNFERLDLGSKTQSTVKLGDASHGHINIVSGGDAIYASFAGSDLSKAPNVWTGDNYLSVLDPATWKEVRRVSLPSLGGAEFVNGVHLFGGRVYVFLNSPTTERRHLYSADPAVMTWQLVKADIDFPGGGRASFQKDSVLYEVSCNSAGFGTWTLDLLDGSVTTAKVSWVY
ncbi:MAG: hypothetical protein WCG80_13080 [Spirochaetales bacterium]